MAAGFAAQQSAIEQGTEPALDPYAATNRSEFFAVATEAFFETPGVLKEHLPDVYEQLRRFYRQDPASRRL